MKVLFIGGTGTISSAISEKVLADGHELWLINRGNRSDRVLPGTHVICADINNEAYVAQQLEGMQFDVVANFVAYVPEHVERDYRLFRGRTKQYIFISTATVYKKPGYHHQLRESSALFYQNWAYSRNKLLCEDLLMKLYRQEQFPVTIVRPSHTYGKNNLPNAVQGANGTYQLVLRMKAGKPVLIHGDGTSLWTLTYNHDFAKGFTGLMGNIHAIGEAVHITGDEALTWNQIYQIIADALGVAFKPFYVSSAFLDAVGYGDLGDRLLSDKTHSLVFDNSKLKTLVPEFQATTRFDQGVRHVLQYLEEHPQYQIEDPEFDTWCDRVIAAQLEAQEKMRCQ